MKNIYIIKLAIFVLFSFISADVKIGYLNADKILTELDEVRQVQIELEKEQRKLNQNI